MSHPVAVLIGASDPQWLPSTIVQSSAALVAIVGGLLVARLVGLSAERATLQRRARDLGHELAHSNERLKVLEIERYTWDQLDFMKSAAYHFFSDDVTDLDGLVAGDYAGSLEEQREWARLFLKHAQDLVPKLEALQESADPPSSLDDLADASLIIDPPFDAIAEEYLSVTRPTPDYLALAHINRPDDVGRAAELARWENLQRDIDAARSEVAQLKQALEVAEADLAGVTPTGVFAVLIALGVVVVAGIAFPVIVLAMDWPDLSAPWRVAQVVAFLASVAGVGVFIYRLAADVSPPQRDVEADPDIALPRDVAPLS